MLIYFMGHEIPMNVRHPHEKPMSPSSKNSLLPTSTHQNIRINWVYIYNAKYIQKGNQSVILKDDEVILM